jgi:transglutaminase-like putative cysteine protease
MPWSRTRRHDIGTEGLSLAFPLAPDQMRWVGLLLVAAQLPLVATVPRWVAVFGIALVGVRFALLRRERLRSSGPAMLASPLLLLAAAVATGIALRFHFGYFAGRDPCVAFLFVLLGIKFLEARSSRDGALLVCLSGFLVVAQFLYNQSLFAAFAGLPAVLLIAAVLLQLTRPAGRVEPLREWRPVLARSARMLAQGIPVALLLFLFFPRLAAPLWGLPNDRMAKTGLSDRMTPGLISELSLSDAVAFRVDFDQRPPPPSQRYWRGPVLSAFDGRNWSMGGRGEPGRIESSSRQPVSYTVTLEPQEGPWLFALEFPASLPVAAGTDDDGYGAPLATLTREKELVTKAQSLQPLQYRIVSNPGADFPAGDATRLARDRAVNLRLPPWLETTSPRTIAFARALRVDHGDDTELAAAVLRHFHDEPFVYTLSPPPLGERFLDGFLFETRRGFCEHYAGAFVVLMRAAGIPARVVTGYQGGEINPRGGYMIVRQSDAHAWAELLIDGRWQRYDPTAAVAPSRIEMGLGAALPAGEPVPLLARLDSGWLKTLQLGWDAVNHQWRHLVVGFNHELQRAMLRELSLDQLPAWQVMALIGGLGLAWLGALLGWLAWRRRRRDPVRTAWDALGRRLAGAGLPRQPHEGPLDYMARATARWPEFAAAFAVIGDAYAQLRYGAQSAQGPARRAALGRLRRAAQVLPGSFRLRRADTRNGSTTAGVASAQGR